MQGKGMAANQASTVGMAAVLRANENGRKLEGFCEWNDIDRGHAQLEVNEK